MAGTDIECDYRAELGRAGPWEWGYADADLVDWLRLNGWYDGRDIAGGAEDLIRARVEDSRRQGLELRPVAEAQRVIHSYGLLSLKHPNTPEFELIMKPTIGYDGDVEDIDELSSGLGVSLFPMGCALSGSRFSRKMAAARRDVAPWRGSDSEIGADDVSVSYANRTIPALSRVKRPG